MNTSRHRRSVVGEETLVRIRAMAKFSQPWNRERFVGHWREMLNDGKTQEWQRRYAMQALKNLGAMPDRIPGADDE